MEDYKKKYEEALERAKTLHKLACETQYDNTRLAVEELFPELKESEDERIRKELHDFCMKCFHGETIVNQKADFQRWATWLEKQGEQKPAWSKDDENGFSDALYAIQQARTIAKNENDMGNLWYAEKWLKSIKERMKGE